MYLCGESCVCYILPLVMRDMWEKVEPKWCVCFHSRSWRQGCAETGCVQSVLLNLSGSDMLPL